MTSYGFTGSRSALLCGPPLLRQLEQVTGGPWGPVEQVVTGGCTGVDACVGQWMHVHFPQARHVLKLPPSTPWLSPWWEYAGPPQAEIARYGSCKERNQAIVDACDWVFAFPAFGEDDPRSRRSGTWQTIRMARRAGNLATVTVLAPPARPAVAR